MWRQVAALALLSVHTTDFQRVPSEAGMPLLGVRDGCISWARARRLLSWRPGRSHPLCLGLGLILVCPPALPGHWSSQPGSWGLYLPAL